MTRPAEGPQVGRRWAEAARPRTTRVGLHGAVSTAVGTDRATTRQEVPRDGGDGDRDDARPWTLRELPEHSSAGPERHGRAPRPAVPGPARGRPGRGGGGELALHHCAEHPARV